MRLGKHWEELAVPSTLLRHRHRYAQLARSPMALLPLPMLALELLLLLLLALRLLPHRHLLALAPLHSIRELQRLEQERDQLKTGSGESQCCACVHACVRG